MPPRAAAADALTADLRVVVLFGGEPMLIRLRLFESRAALADVLDELRSPMLMASHNLVIVDDADAWVVTHREGLAKYLDAPAEGATLVLRATQWNKGNLDKAIEKHGAIVKCDRLYPSEAQAWLARRATQHHGVRLDPAAAQRLVERIGSDLGLLDSELGKLAALAGERGTVTVAAVDEVVGRSSDEKAWAMQEAVLEEITTGEAGPALAKLHEVLDLAGEEQIVASFAVADLMRKLALASEMKKQGMNDYAIGSALKIWPKERQGVFLAASAKLKDRAPAWFDRAIAADRRAKSGLGDAARNLECLLVGLADDVRQRRGGAR